MSISRRSLLKGMAATSAVAATAGCATSPSTLTASDSKAPPKKQPNLLIVFPDEMRAHALGFMKQDPSDTPHLNRFAKQSVVLRQAVSNFPLCTPFRGMLMTGQYPYRNGIQATAIPQCQANLAVKILELN
ncbi:sulfatase-like hydrolase/transferase [Photobacterium swingsii]|uniref:sulfatase-like hydrolase/transferase n=1 Tax=Photobacterium swingsii TaxID=680026 RepID=UPI000B0F473B|nr:sulfatase-like hydrolase/transferase [Photobacterium swingsii]